MCHWYFFWVLPWQSFNLLVNAEVSCGSSAFVQPGCSPAVCAERVHTDGVLLWEKASVFEQNRVALQLPIIAPSHHRSPAGLFQGRPPPCLMRSESLPCRDKVLSAGPLYLVGENLHGDRRSNEKLLSSEIFETRQCLSAEDWRVGSRPIQLLH